jgi:hypothetical protein
MQQKQLIDLQDQLNMFRAKNCLKYVELILEINKSFWLHPVGLPILFTYIDDARSNTNQIRPSVKISEIPSPYMTL